MRRVVIIGSASGNGKTTLGRALAQRLAVPFVELDALVHGPNWTETPDDELRAALRPIVAEDGWVIDGDYQRKLGTLVLDRADTIVWLDLPTRVWVPRLARRSMRRISGREPLWNGKPGDVEDRETLKTTVWGCDSLFGYAFRQQRRRRREWPERFAHLPVTRLRSPREVERWIANV